MVQIPIFARLLRGSMLAQRSSDHVLAARSLGVLAYGVLLGWIGLRDTLVVLAAVNLVVPLILWLAPALRSASSPSAKVPGQPALS